MNKLAIIIFTILVAGLGVLFFTMQTQKTQKNQTTPLNVSGNNQYSINQSVTTNPPSPTQEATPNALQTATKAIIHTSKGDITLELYPDVAPKTVSNFVSKAKSGYYNKLIFHRVEDWVIQGGDPKGDGTGGGNMVTEFNNKPYVAGSLGVARRSDPKTQNDSQFFITKTPASWLNKGYTNFGLVTEGMDVVNKIAIGDTIQSIEIE